MGVDEIYTGDDLGARVENKRTKFRLWSPTAEQVFVNLFRRGNGGADFQQVEMERGEGGSWFVNFNENLTNVYYTYSVTIQGKTRECPDPYARSAGVNGKRSMVLGNEEACPPMKTPLPFVKSVVAEVSIRDMTADPDCGIPEAHRGKFLGLTDRGCVSKSGVPAGLDYLAGLGVTHVQLMPFYDFGSIDESKPLAHQYNWGYDPVNYNVPEGSYSTDPFDGQVRVRECRAMIRAIHEAGMGVIMDVVYNHVFDGAGSVFEACAPGYFFRMGRKAGKRIWSNASGCGNELATERPMVRKYIIDSMKYWVKAYGIDGFRMDLMGVFDRMTVALIRRELEAIRPGILLYGEGWAAGPSVLPQEKRAVKGGGFFPVDAGMFSDDIRDSIKGSVFDEKDRGYVNGRPEFSGGIRACVCGSVSHPQVTFPESCVHARMAWASDPAQVVNYVSCHDNLTLWDKLTLSVPGASVEKRLSMNRLAATIVFTAQGMPFFLCGEESGRTKPMGGGKYSGNSYDLPVEVNRLDYARMTDFRELSDFYRGLIRFRRAFPDLWYDTGDQVRKNLHFSGTKTDVVAFTLQGKGRKVFVAYNGADTPAELEIPGQKLMVLIDEKNAGTKELSLQEKKLVMPGISQIVGLLI